MATLSTFSSMVTNTVPPPSTWLRSARDLAIAHPYLTSGLGILAAWQGYQRILKPGISALTRSFSQSGAHADDPALKEQVAAWEERGNAYLGTMDPDCSKVDMSIIRNLLACNRRDQLESLGKESVKVLSNASVSERLNLLRDAGTAGEELLSDVDTKKPHQRAHKWPYEKLRVLGYLLENDGSVAVQDDGTQVGDGDLTSTMQALSRLRASMSSDDGCSTGCDEYAKQLKRKLHSCFGPAMSRIRALESIRASGGEQSTAAGIQSSVLPAQLKV